MDGMSQHQRNILRHSLGLLNGTVIPRKVEDPDWPWRNHYATAPDCDGYADVLDLVDAGYMEQGRPIEGGLIYFHVTTAGIRKALE